MHVGSKTRQLPPGEENINHCAAAVMFIQGRLCEEAGRHSIAAPANDDHKNMTAYFSRRSCKYCCHLSSKRKMNFAHRSIHWQRTSSPPRWLKVNNLNRTDAHACPAFVPYLNNRTGCHPAKRLEKEHNNRCQAAVLLPKRWNICHYWPIKHAADGEVPAHAEKLV